MAIVKVSFVKHAANVLNYVMREREPADPLDAHDCFWENAHRDFEAIRAVHHGKGAVQAVHVMQSWNAEESKRLAPADFNSMGRQLAEGHFPGHAFVVVTHTQTDNTHNHIVVCPWHTATGKKIDNKFRHLHELRTLNDRLCQSRGLSVIDGKAKERERRLPDVVQKIARFNGRSWLLDLCQKADFARAWATNYDEYVGIMGEFGVSARVEDKNITYFYPGKERGKRGGKLGQKFDKPGLELAFKENDGRFQAHPELRSFVRGAIDQVRQHPRMSRSIAKSLMEQTSGAFQEGRDYSAFTKRPRSSRAGVYAHEVDLKGSMVPLGELRKARSQNILEYCRNNKIEMSKSQAGEWTLKGRDYVVLSDYEWVNKKNRTRGSLIEFVAAHKDLTLLQAVATINRNPRLLALEDTFGPTKRTFTSFYVPKEERLHGAEAVARVGTLLKAHGVHETWNDALMRSGQAQVARSGLIRLFGKGDGEGAMEYFEDSPGSWKQRKHGAIKTPFFSSRARGREAVIFLDPFCFMSKMGKDAFAGHRDYLGVLCLLEPDHRCIDQFLAENKSVKKLRVVQSGKAQRTSTEVDFFNSQKSRYQSLGIEFDLATRDFSPPGKGVEMSFH